METYLDVNTLLKPLVRVALFDEDKAVASELLLETAEKMYRTNPEAFADYFAAVASLRRSIKMFAMFLGDREFDVVVRYYGMTQDMAVFNLKLATFKSLQNAVAASVRSRTGYLF